MKKTLLMLTVVVASALTMYGQGRVSFNNTASGNLVTVTTDATRAGVGQGAPGSGLESQYSIQLLWAPAGTYADDHVAFLAALLGQSTPVSFIGGGSFIGGTTPIGPVQTYTMAARAFWNNGQFATFDASNNGGNNTGWSPYFNMTPTASPTPAPVTLAMQSFAVSSVPEPSTFALAGLGAAALLLFRRRK
jgi:hypothetical protein